MLPGFFCALIMNIQLLEYVVSDPSLKVDREAGVLRSVKILGHRSGNGYEYAPSAIQAASKLYDGKVVNFNHPGKSSDSRSSYDRFGWLTSIQVKEDGLYGDLHYLKSHPFAAPVVEAAERNPGLFGMSHVANGEKVRRGNRFVIEQIDAVASVDLVSNPATVKGLFESQTMSQTTIREVLKAALIPEKFKLLSEQDYPMDATMAPPMNGMNSEHQAHEAFKAMIMAVLDDSNMDMKSMLKKIKDILMAKEKLMGAGETESMASEAGGESMAAEESVKKVATVEELQERLSLFERRDQIRLLCDSQGLVPSPVQWKALVALKEESDVKALIAEFKQLKQPGLPGSNKPRSAAPSRTVLTEEQIKLPTTVQELKSFILN